MSKTDNTKQFDDVSPFLWTNHDLQRSAYDYRHYLSSIGKYHKSTLHRTTALHHFVSQDEVYVPSSHDRLYPRVSPRSANAVPFVMDSDGTYFVSSNELSNIEKGNALTIGTISGIVRYQPDPFIAGPGIVVVRTEWMTECKGLFFAPLLEGECKKRLEGGETLSPETILRCVPILPMIVKGDDGEIDWDFIEYSMRVLLERPLSELLPSQSE